MKTYQADELQAQIDDVYACPGSCPGCILAVNERRATDPDMSEQVMTAAIDALRKHVIRMPDVKKFNLTFGIADHGRMSTKYIVDTYLRGRQLLEETGFNDGKSAIFMTFSLVGKNKKVLDTMAKLREAVKDDIPLIPIAVFDPIQYLRENYGAIYEKNIVAIKDMFGVVDLSINLSVPAVRIMSAKATYEMVRSHGFGEMTINWVPTADNLMDTCEDLQEILDWIIELRGKPESIRTDNGPEFTSHHYTLWCETNDIRPNHIQPGEPNQNGYVERFNRT
jgi:hypothetical protein